MCCNNKSAGCGFFTILPSGWLSQGLDQGIAFSEPGPVDPEEIGLEVGM